MEIILSKIIGALIGAVSLGVVFTTLIGLSMGVLSILFVVTAGLALITLLIVSPIILLPIIPLLLLWIAWCLLRKYAPCSIHWIHQHIFQNIQGYYLQYRHSLQVLPNRLMTPHYRQTLISIIWIAVAALLVLTYHVLNSRSLTLWNLPMYYTMRGIRSPLLEGFFVKISLFNSLIMSLFWGIMSVYFIYKKDSWRATHWILLGLLIGSMTIGLKYSTGIARPGAIFYIKDSFPSAHMSANMTLLGGLMLLVKTHPACYVFYGAWMYLMAFSRLYLAAHWLTDIVGGILISLISLSLFKLSYDRKIPKSILSSEVGLFSVGTLISLWFIRFVLEYDRILQFYLASI